MKSLEQYRELLKDRPVKFGEQDVNYRDSELIAQHCARCLHFFERKQDNFGVCEVFRAKGEEAINPDYVCDFFTVDGEKFPFQE